jgi:hypothetical protein
MSAQTYAQHAKTGPNPATVQHVGFPAPAPFNCHAAALYWMFRDMALTAADARGCITAIVNATCPGCLGRGAHGTGLPPDWYGRTFCQNTTAITTRAALFGAVSVGDVLVTGNPPGFMAHSMVVVEKKNFAGRRWVYVRGFNNAGTFGGSSPRDAYDNHDRDCDKDSLWRAGVGGTQQFGFGAGSNLHVVTYANYRMAAQAVLTRAHAKNGVWHYRA